MQSLSSQSCSARTLTDIHLPLLSAACQPGVSAPAPSASPALPSTEVLTHNAANLLTALGLYADLLSAPGVLPPQYRCYASELRLLADRGASLWKQALQPERDAAAQPVRTRGEEPLCEPAEVLRRFVPQLQAELEGGVVLLLRLPRSAPPLSVPGDALERIAAHLVCEAAQVARASVAQRDASAGVEAAPVTLLTSTTVWIGLEIRDGTARLIVEASGSGMPQNVATSLSAGEPAPYRQRLLWSRHGVHALVRESGGRMIVRPRPASGTVTTVHWPLSTPTCVRVYPADVAGVNGKVVDAC